MLQIPELLSPAGDLERLRYAINYGADAVYCSLPEFGMRSAPANFTPEQLTEGVIVRPWPAAARSTLTMNTLPTNEEADRCRTPSGSAAAAGVDASLWQIWVCWKPASSSRRTLMSTCPPRPASPTGPLPARPTTWAPSGWCWPVS